MFIKTRQKIFLASLLYRCVRVVRGLRGLSVQDVFSRSNLRWELDLEEGIDFSIYLRGAFEPDLVRFFRQHVKPDDLVFDIGANIGAHTLHFADIATKGNGCVYAIEATAYAFEKLERNLKLNPELEQSAVIFHLTLVGPGDQEKELEIFSSWPLTGGKERHEQHRGVSKTTGDAAQIMLDQLVEELKIPKVDWMKIDVDGHELQVLKGAEKTLNQHHPKIVIELAHDYISPGESSEFLEMVGILCDLGYTFYTLSGKKLPDSPEGLVGFIPHGTSLNAYCEVK